MGQCSLQVRSDRKVGKCSSVQFNIDTRLPVFDFFASQLHPEPVLVPVKGRLSKLVVAQELVPQCLLAIFSWAALAPNNLHPGGRRPLYQATQFSRVLLGTTESDCGSHTA